MLTISVSIDESHLISCLKEYSKTECSLASQLGNTINIHFDVGAKDWDSRVSQPTTAHSRTNIWVPSNRCNYRYYDCRHNRSYFDYNQKLSEINSGNRQQIQRSKNFIVVCIIWKTLQTTNVTKNPTRLQMRIST